MKRSPANVEMISNKNKKKFFCNKVPLGENSIKNTLRAILFIPKITLFSKQIKLRFVKK